ncbi:glutathione S-transferase family protein [Aspergillus stella-maris]|uniref:glutathione S-transferase family protein n=1 Tax=Aspergillus stella-maris TaxID=1810926 RepID=UPI003CCDA8FF
MASDSQIVFFHYPFSPFSARVLYYLTLRGIPYDQCIQPKILPRPDLNRLGIKYRRIPLLSIGRDVYLDSALILRTLEKIKGANPPFSSQTTPAQHGIEGLLSKFTMETGLFRNIVQILLPSTPLMHDEAFMKDRMDMMGGGSGGSASDFAKFVLAGRSDAIVSVKNAFQFLESTLLADERDWLAGTEKPGLADIEMVWPIHWLVSVPGALPEEYISASLYPRVFSWVERFQKAIEEAKKSAREPASLSGEEVAEILKKAVADGSGDVVDEGDPLVKENGWKKGQMVQVWPSDSGSRHKTVGRLLGLTAKETTIETVEGDISVRVHAPRQAFQVAEVSAEKANLS